MLGALEGKRFDPGQRAVQTERGPFQQQLVRVVRGVDVPARQVLERCRPDVGGVIRVTSLPGVEPHEVVEAEPPVAHLIDHVHGGQPVQRLDRFPQRRHDEGRRRLDGHLGAGVQREPAKIRASSCDSRS